MSQPQSGNRRRRSELPAGAPFPTSNEIAERAHDLFVAGGRRVTKIFEYWNQAEQELLDRAARRTVSKG